MFSQSTSKKLSMLSIVVLVVASLSLSQSVRDARVQTRCLVEAVNNKISAQGKSILTQYTKADVTGAFSTFQKKDSKTGATSNYSVNVVVLSEDPTDMNRVANADTLQDVAKLAASTVILNDSKSGPSAADLAKLKAAAEAKARADAAARAKAAAEAKARADAAAKALSLKQSANNSHAATVAAIEAAIKQARANAQSRARNPKYAAIDKAAYAQQQSNRARNASASHWTSKPSTPQRRPINFWNPSPGGGSPIDYAQIPQNAAWDCLMYGYDTYQWNSAKADFVKNPGKVFTTGSTRARWIRDSRFPDRANGFQGEVGKLYGPPYCARFVYSSQPMWKEWLYFTPRGVEGGKVWKIEDLPNWQNYKKKRVLQGRNLLSIREAPKAAPVQDVRPIVCIKRIPEVDNSAAIMKSFLNYSNTVKANLGRLPTKDAQILKSCF